MELTLGTEPTRTYLAFELAQGARKLVEDVMQTKAGEDLVITADTSSDWRVVEATAQAAYAAGARPTVVWYESRPDAVMEPPGPVAGAVREADVWIDVTDTFAAKLEAIALHRSQVRDREEVARWMSQCNRDYGAQVGCADAETFKLLHPFCQL